MQSTADFFTDKPLSQPMDGWRADWAARIAVRERWADHVVDSVNGHLVWRLASDQRPGVGRVFYDGDYSDVLAPDDPRALVPRAECADLPPWPLRLEWDK